MATIPSAGYISNASRTQGELKQSLEDVVASLRQVPGSGQTELSNTISSGSITPAGSGGILTIDTEAAAATDDLTNIVTTNYPDGSCLIIRNLNASRFVVVKNAAGGAGQINLDRAADHTLDDTKKWLMIQRRGADWYEIFRGPTRVWTITVAKSATFTVNSEDVGKTFLCTNTITANLLAVASAGNGYTVTIKNTGTGTVTIDGNASETIDGSTTISVLPGWAYELVCTGSAWISVLSTSTAMTVNPIINGNMEVWQRNTTLAGVSGIGLIADRWLYRNAIGTGVVTINRSTTVPTVAQAGVLFNYSHEIDVTTADATVAAGDLYTLRHRMEGGNWRHFAQRQFTLSFWVSSTKTGIHCVAFRNGTVADRSYVAEYTVNAADTWEYKTITVSASPSTGTWNYTTSLGLELAWSLAAGSTYQTTAGAWQTGDFFATSNQVNVMDSAVNFFRVTGVKMEIGSVATPIEFLSFEDELRRCLRYYQKSFNYATAPQQNSGVGASAYQFTAPATSTAAITRTIFLHTAMRTSPTVTLYNPSAANAQVRNTTDAADDNTSSGTGYEKMILLQFTPNATNTLGDLHSVHWAADAEL